jgi:hypothetical protein
LRVAITDRGRGIIILRTNSPFGRRWRSNWEKVQMAPPARCGLLSRRWLPSHTCVNALAAMPAALACSPGIPPRRLLAGDVVQGRARIRRLVPKHQSTAIVCAAIASGPSLHRHTARRSTRNPRRSARATAPQLALAARVASRRSRLVLARGRSWLIGDGGDDRVHTPV